MGKKIAALLACVFAAVLFAVPTSALAQSFTPTPDATLDNNGVLHWDAEGEYYSRIDLGDLMFGPDSSDACEKPVNGEYTYDIENLFQTAEQLYGSIGDGDVSGLNGGHSVTFVYYERQSNGTMKEVGRAQDAFTYTYTTGRLVQLLTPGNLSWTGDGFTASWDTVEHAEGYWVRLYETTSGGTSVVSTKTVEGSTFQLTSFVATPKDGATYAFEVRAIGPAGDAQYVTSDWSTKSEESVAWKTPVVEYGLFVGGTEVTSANAADVLDDGTVSYDPDTQTLTLTNATISNVNVTGCSIEVDPGKTLPLTIALEGTNSCGPIMTQKGTITISGSGTLTVTQPLSGTGQTGISVQDDLVIDGVKLTVNSNESGVHTNVGNVTIKNGAQVEITTKTDMAYVALLSSGDLTVTGAGTSLKATTERNDPDYELSIHCQGKFLIEQGASVETSGRMISAGELRVQDEGSLLKATGTEASTNAVSGQDSVIISDGATVEATGRLLGRNGITVEDSTLDVESIGTGMAVYSNYGALSFSDSTVTVTSAMRYALYASTGVSMDGGTITLEGAQGAIYVNNGNVSFGSDPTWYQWATSPAGAVKLAATDPYSYAGDASTYLRFEPADTTYELTVENGTGGGSYAPGTQVPVSTDSYDEDGHFTGWTIDDPTGAGVLAADNAASTTFTMPAGNVTLTANSKNHVFTHVEGKAPTCTEAGWEAYDECACGYTTAHKEIPATDHAWGKPAWSWNDDYTEFVATFTCANDKSHVEVLTAKPTVTIQAEPTCTEPGTMLYSASVEFGGKKHEAIVMASIPAIDHTYKDGVCTTCGAEDPDYVAPGKPKPAGEEDDGSIPAAGDASTFFSAVPALAGACALRAGVVLRRRR